MHAPSAPRAAWFQRARYALHAALVHCGVGPGAVVLAPAYHCRTLLDPAKALGASLALYPVHPDLTADGSAVQKLLRQHGDRVRAVLAVHYFGLRQDTRAWRTWCDEFGVALVEDCSHCLVGPDGLPLDAGIAGAPNPADPVFADHVVASPYKFYASADGGTWWSRDGRHRATAATRLPWFQQARSWAGLAAELLLPRTGQGLPTLSAASPGPCGNDFVESDLDKPSPAFSAELVNLAGHASSRWLMEHSRPEVIADRRRERYCQWMHELTRLSSIRPALGAMQPRDVPYAFPAVLKGDLGPFFTLKRWGIPVGRWDDLLESDCGNARRYRTHLIQLPCHQELTDLQMDWLIGGLRRAVLH